MCQTTFWEVSLHFLPHPLDQPALRAQRQAVVVPRLIQHDLVGRPDANREWLFPEFYMDK
jgi:hypothetical protein